MTTTVLNLYEYKQFAYNSNLKSRALSVLMYLVDRADNHKFTCYPSISTIGENLHISISTVKRAMKELLEKGYLKREARFAESKNGGQTSNLYTLSVPEEMPEAQPTTEEVVTDDICHAEIETNCVEPVIEPRKAVKSEVRHISFDTIVKEKKAKAVKTEIADVEEIVLGKSCDVVLDVESEKDIEVVKNEMTKPLAAKRLYRKIKTVFSQRVKYLFVKKNATCEHIFLDHVDEGGVHFDSPFNYTD